MQEHDIKTIAKSSLNSIDQVISQWCPGGKRQGHEYVALNPTRGDNNVGSFSVNLNTGAWADFATGDKGGDLVALVAYVDNVKQGEASNRLAKFLGISKNEAGKHSTTNKINTQKSNQHDKGDGFECVMPIPFNAMKPMESHRRHGKPSARHAYLSLSGDVNFYHDRFEPKNDGDRKRFAPLTYWFNEKLSEGVWRYKAPPANRPLYNLPSLVKFTDTPVWIVEGEKAADALTQLMPDRAVVSWQGGSQAVFKADFSSLAGRECVIWPDNDEPGLKARDSVIQMLDAIGVKAIQYVDVNVLKECLKHYQYTLELGDDAADLKAHGLTAENVSAALFRQGVIVDRKSKQKPKSAGGVSSPHVFSRHFQLLDEGVYMVDVTNDGKAYKPPKLICARLDVLALSRSPDNEGWGLLVKFNDRDFHQHRFIIPAKSFNGDGLEATGLLYEKGLDVAPKSRHFVLEYLQHQTPEKRVRVTNRIGWHGEGDDLVYVMPSGAIGGSAEEWVFDTLDPNQSTFKQKGTLEAWRKNVSMLAIGNSRLLFALSIAFAAPLRHIADMKDIGGFHYRGASSDGKSTALRMAGSICGGLDYMQRWRATDNGLEGMAMQHCDAPLLLDELKQIDPKVAGEAAYMLTNGTGKTRSNEKGAARKTAQWRVMFLSAGEISLSQHMMEANKRSHAGQEVRMADIPVDSGAGLGCFEELHGSENGNDFAQRILQAISKNYGHAFPAFISWLKSENQLELRERIANVQQAFTERLLTKSASGQARRVASIFALVGAAGELAGEAEITGWEKGLAFKAATTCYKAWLEGYGGEGDQESRAMLSQVRLFLENHGEGRFADIGRNAVDDNHAARVVNRAGYRKHQENATTLVKSTEWWMFPETFRDEVCKGFDHKAVVKLLVSRGYMHKGDGRNIGKPKRDTPEGRMRVYVINSSIFDDDAE